MTHTLDNSTFLDFTSYGTTNATTVADAYGLHGQINATSGINVAFVLPRANDATALLTSDWGTRQATLEQLNENGTLWSTYGATTADYTSAINTLSGYGTILGTSGSDGYVTSQESRTIWVQLSATQFGSLFGTSLYQSKTDGGMLYWNNSLSLPDGVHATGLWFDTAPIFGTPPAVATLSAGPSVIPPQGQLSIGNGLAPVPQIHPAFAEANNYSGDVASAFYHYPLAGIDVPTALVGLLEPGIGSALQNGGPGAFEERLDAFRQGAGISKPGSYYVLAENGQSYDIGNSGERSLDVGVVTSAVPNSTIGLYVGSGFGPDAGVGGTTLYANSNAYTAFQAAFWDESNNPPVLSSSFALFQQSSPHSPFAEAVKELFIDAALRNITTVFADNDYGSSWSFGNGLANQATNMSSYYALMIGGTSLTTLAMAPFNSTVSGAPTSAESLYGLAMAGDPATIWRLVEGGLMHLPSAAAGLDAAQITLLESVWNSYALSGTNLQPSLITAAAGDGGVDTAHATPWYQTAFGLTPTSANPGGGTGRGVPDVSANAGGNMFYLTPDSNMTSLSDDDGTSAAAPMWASLIAQIDTIFHDQGLPNLGFANDLIYQAAAIAPASFNDITFGNNITSFFYGGPILSDGTPVTLTGHGYLAGPGYDLATGLGTPNGTLLARALTEIAQAQMWFHAKADMLHADGHGGWTSGADQSLLLQTMSVDGAHVDLTSGPDAFGFFSRPSDTYAWTSQLAQQSLQADFDPNLVILFDKQAQGTVGQSTVHSGQSLAVSIDSSSAQAIQGSLSSPFGFADFLSDDGVVRVARPVAVAETAHGANDQIAIVRLRQDGQDNLSLTFYRVDDLNGTINGLHPGDAGYQEALQGRAYQMTTGGTSIGGPGYGDYGQTALQHVNAGDLIAMQLTNNTHGNSYLGFAQANETSPDGQHVGHLWNYGLNTWGWEDTYGGGDHDYNDMIVQLDFTSASGHGWLA